MAHIACGLCGAEAARPLFKAKDRVHDGGKVYSLVTCGLVCLAHRPDEPDPVVAQVKA